MVFLNDDVCILLRSVYMPHKWRSYDVYNIEYKRNNFSFVFFVLFAWCSIFLAMLITLNFTRVNQEQHVSCYWCSKIISIIISTIRLPSSSKGWLRIKGRSNGNLQGEIDPWFFFANIQWSIFALNKNYNSVQIRVIVPSDLVGLAHHKFHDTKKKKKS